MILGGLIQGIKVENGAFAGGPFDWATPFALLCGLGAGRRLCAARRDLAGDEDRRRGRRARAHAGQDAPARRARLHGAGQPVDAARDSSASPSAGSRCRTSYYLWPVPLVTALTAFAAVALARDAAATSLPFLAAIALFLLGYLGLVISSFPYLVPPSLTIWETAAAPASQIFMLIGTLVLLPIILGYIVVRVLALPRQGARRRRLSLSAARRRLMVPWRAGGGSRCRRDLRLRTDDAPADAQSAAGGPARRARNERGGTSGRDPESSP